MRHFLVMLSLSLLSLPSYGDTQIFTGPSGKSLWSSVVPDTRVETFDQLFSGGPDPVVALPKEALRKSGYAIWLYRCAAENRSLTLALCRF